MRIRDPSLRAEDWWRRVSYAIGPMRENFASRDLNALKLDKYELKYVVNYIRKHIDPNVEQPYYSWDEPAKPLVVHNKQVQEALYDILTAPIDRSTWQGRDRERIRQVFGMSSRVDTMVSMAAVKVYGPDVLAPCMVALNGHETNQSFGLWNMLAASGLEDAGYKASNYSGNVGMPALFAETLGRSMIRAEGPMKLETADQFIERLETTKKKPIICVNAGPIVTAKQLSPALLKRIADGDIRFILHNQADIEAMQKLPVKAVIINLALSQAKVLEAQVIGEQWAVLASDNLLKHCDVPIRSGIAIIKGYGILGSSVANGFGAFGYAKDQTYIIETDPARREAAIKAGFTKVFAEIPEECRNAKAAAVIVATNRVGFKDEDVDKLPLKSTVMTLTSGGVGIDLNSVASKFPGKPGTTFNKTGVGGGLTEDSYFTNLHYKSASGRQLTVVNCRKNAKNGALEAYPQNLVKPIGQTRLVTSAMILLAVIQAAMTDKPSDKAYDITPQNMQILDEALNKYRPKGRDPSLIKALTPEGMRAAVDALVSMGPHEPDHLLVARARREIERDASFARSMRFMS